MDFLRSTGVGLQTKKRLAIRAILMLDLQLPNVSRALRIQARVLWVRQHGVAGCEFIRVNSDDLEVLQAWFKNRSHVAKPG